MVKPRQLENMVNEFVQFGWEISIPTHAGIGNNDMGGPMIYFCDIEPNELYVVALTADAIDHVAKLSEDRKLTFDDACSALGSLLADVASGKAELTSETRGSIAVGAAMYIPHTKSYAHAQANGGLANWQFIVMRQPDASTGDYILRPFPVLSSRPLSPLEIAEYVIEILAVDRITHPERFPSAALLQFNPKGIRPV